MTEPTDYLRVSYSSLNTFATCNRKFEFSKLYPKRERDWEDTYAADVGKALHAGFQDYLVHSNREAAIWTFMREFPYTDEYNQRNLDRGFDASLCTLECMFDNARMNEYELARIVRPPSPAELLEASRLGIESVASRVVPAIEVPFELRFKGITLPDGRGIAFTGFIDAILRNLSTEMFRTCDIKTSRVNLADATPKFKFDSQQIPYGIVVEHVAQQPVEEFEVLYLDSYIDLVEPSVKLYPFLKRQEDVQEWIANKVIQFQAIRRYMETDYFPRTDGGCLHWNRACAYLEPCMSRSKSDLTEWFLLGEEPAKAEAFHPWIIADIDVTGVRG